MKRNKHTRGSAPLRRIVRRTMYSLLTNNWRLTISLAVVAGLVCSLFYVGRDYYENYTSAWASISIIYPNISSGTYPDGSRFTLYSLANEENVSAVLDDMQAEGKYTEFSTEDLMQCIRVTAVVESGVKETVTSMQTAGNNYSYFASEYELSFVQPRVEGAPLREQLREENYSAEFLERLIALDAAQLEHMYGGVDSFRAVLDYQLPDQLDYSEWVTFYASNTRAVRNYLQYLNKNAGNYRSESTGKTIADLKSLFATMGTTRLDEIDNYIQNSGLAIDRESLINKITVQIENDELKYKKQLDKVEANGYAKDEYDHTFTENLIVVATSDDYGLYQARPKTVFDTVVNQYNDALIASIELKASIEQKEKDLLLYTQAEESAEDYQRMNKKCEELIATYESDYASLCDVAYTTVEEFLNDRNNGYMDFMVEEKKLFSLNLLIKAGIMFAVGGMVVVMTSLVIAPLFNMLSIKNRHRKMRRIHASQRKNYGEGGSGQ